MKSLLLLASAVLAAVALSACSGTQATTTGSNPTVPVAITHQLNGNVLTAVATVTNNTEAPISFVKNRNFYSISVTTADPADSRVVFPKIVTFPPVVSNQVVNVAPGQSTSFSASFQIRPLNELAYDLERVDQPFSPRSYQVMQSRKLRTTFEYNHFPRFLNERSKKVAKGFLTVPIKSQAPFQLPR